MFFANLPFQDDLTSLISIFDPDNELNTMNIKEESENKNETPKKSIKNRYLFPI